MSVFFIVFFAYFFFSSRLSFLLVIWQLQCNDLETYIALSWTFGQRVYVRSNGGGTIAMEDQYSIMDC